MEEDLGMVGMMRKAFCGDRSVDEIDRGDFWLYLLDLFHDVIGCSMVGDLGGKAKRKRGEGVYYMFR